MLTDESDPQLARPAELADAPVAAWEAELTLPTYAPADPEQLPMYLDRRVYQGSSGRVYPLPFHHRIEERPTPRRWRAVHLQNAWLHVVVLPELGGRIHLARDRASGRDIFWANPVIKPALVGLAGPWLAGGVEFNWPQHHRPATYLPTDWTIVHDDDGSVVVWCSDHDPFTRMKGMHGVRLHPGSSRLQVDVRLFNRSETTQSFLWWANVAARVDDDYQSFFPSDVTVVADHAKRAVTSFPHADRPYYGIDYAARAGDVSRAADGTPRRGDQLDWYRNIPVPTSYMCLDSAEDFFGGYDHAARLGFVHVADHQVAVGKKQWTWGNSPFGHAWDANLADDGSHYIELMAGVFTDNQPDFSHLAPGETKVFSQTWYPLRDIGPVDRAGPEAAVRLERDGDEVTVGVVVTRSRPGLEVELGDGRGWHASDVTDLDPGTAYTRRHRAAPGPLTLTVRHRGEVLLSWTEPGQGARAATTDVSPATEPPAPELIDSVEELALTGQHLELYRHPTRAPEPYWQEALRRDGEQLAARTGLALRALRAGRWSAAEEHLLVARGRLLRRHPNPADTTVLYLLGLLREGQGRDAEAYDAYGRASWTRAWRGAAGYRMARIDARHGRHASALARLADVRRVEPEHLQAAALETVCRRRLGDPSAGTVLRAARELDPLDAWLRHLDGQPASSDAQTCLDVALELAGVGEFEDALAVLDAAEEREQDRPSGQTATRPLLHVHRAVLLHRLGRDEEAATAAARAGQVDARWCFPGRLADAAALALALAGDHPSECSSPGDVRPSPLLDDLTALAAGAAHHPRAATLLGTWAYAVGRHDEAAALWRAATAAAPDDVLAWRNLGMYDVNQRGDVEAGRRAYAAACAAAPHDARLRYEADQLAALAGTAPEQRLAEWQQHRELAAERDDASVELAHLMVTAGSAAEAVDLLVGRTFQPWEGGEGQVLAAWERAHVRLALAALADGRAVEAVQHLTAALEPDPAVLGETRHPLVATAQLHLLLGDAEAAAGRPDRARAAWAEAAEQRGDFQAMATQPHSETTFWSVLALHRLGRADEARALTAELAAFRDEMAATEPRVDYFATSLPDLLLFAEDPRVARDRRVAFFDAQLDVLAGRPQQAARRLAQEQASRHGADLLLACTVLGADTLLSGPVPADGARAGADGLPLTEGATR
ncbi:DUF5107 domain-containing protein [Auraticoccus sp. F435]|uniref:DUF5107 domain-containing protein n=1 Tax=Auraticoccus cholistanensis TaxID=2656650 RepID=A0A6A9URA5_9ACTN|nr:DUF5107 domain-containing protein [Auraticoccus cholistanensis]MVA75108.1 DUF5107 domain-containing protein [Auraticoccus cholistanensis]